MVKVNRMFCYRLYPNKSQAELLNKTLSTSCFLYNHLLETRIQEYKENGKSIRKFYLNKLITKFKKENPKLKTVHSQVLQNVSDRVDKAFNNFFRRVKEIKVKPGFPRFKPGKRYKSFTYPQSGFKLRNKLILSKIGKIRIKKHRDLIGTVKTLTIKRTPSDKWFAIFSCEVTLPEAARAKESKIGIDVGLENFATLSDGTIIGNPRHFTKSEGRLKLIQRRLSKKKKGSSNREHAKMKVARLHEYVSNQRNDFLHKLSRRIVNRYGTIVIEDLNIPNMVKHPYLAKHINDASWGTFFKNLAYKAEEAGCEVVRVNPRGTTVECSQCKTRVPKTLAVRWHRCLNCGLNIERDLNSARVILLKGRCSGMVAPATTTTAGMAGSQACGEGSPSLGEICEISPSVNQEATQFNE